jgi:hypothetical protein
MPEANPGLDLRLGFCRMRQPALARARQGVGGTQQLALPRRAPAAFARRGLGQGIELAGEQESRDHLDRLWKVAQEFFGGIAAVPERTDPPPRQLGGHNVHHGAGQRTPGAIRLVVPAGLLLFQLEFQTHRDGHEVPGPQPQGDAHDAERKVQAPQGPIFLARGAGSVAIAGHAFDLLASLFLGGVVKLDDDRVLGRDELGGVPNDAGPYPPARVVEGAPQEDIEPGERLQGGSTRQLQIGGDGVLSRGQRPAAGQEREALPGRGRQESLEQYHHEAPKR